MEKGRDDSYHRPRERNQDEGSIGVTLSSQDSQNPTRTRRTPCMQCHRAAMEIRAGQEYEVAPASQCGQDLMPATKALSMLDHRQVSGNLITQSFGSKDLSQSGWSPASTTSSLNKQSRTLKARDLTAHDFSTKVPSQYVRSPRLVKEIQFN